MFQEMPKPISSDGSSGGVQFYSGKFKTNTSADAGYKVTTGFKPKYIAVQRTLTTSDSNTYGFTYDADMSTNIFAKFAYNQTPKTYTIGTKSVISLISVDDDGFTVYTNESRSAEYHNYFAIG